MRKAFLVLGLLSILSASAVQASTRGLYRVKYFSWFDFEIAADYALVKKCMLDRAYAVSRTVTPDREATERGKERGKSAELVSWGPDNGSSMDIEWAPGATRVKLYYAYGILYMGRSFGKEPPSSIKTYEACVALGNPESSAQVRGAVKPKPEDIVYTAMSKLTAMDLAQCFSMVPGMFNRSVQISVNTDKSIYVDWFMQRSMTLAEYKPGYSYFIRPTPSGSRLDVIIARLSKTVTPEQLEAGLPVKLAKTCAETGSPGVFKGLE